MKSKRGITLIALIITIIILLILTGITMSAIMGDNGILTQAMNASVNTNRENAKEEFMMAWTAGMSRYMEDLSSGKTTENQKYTYFSMARLNEYLGSTGEVKGLRYDPATDEYTIVYTSKASGKSYLFRMTTSGNIEVLKSDVDLASGDVELGEEIINYKIYAIYYPDTKTLAFSNDGSELPEEERGTTEPVIWNNESDSFIADVDESKNNFMLNYSSFLPWSQYAYFDINKVTFINRVYPTDTSFWFNQFRGITSITNIENLRTDFVTNMRYMFYHTTITNLDLTHFNTSNVTNMDSMFSQNQPLLSLNVSSFDTSKVTNMHQMFHYCSNLTILDIRNFNVSNVTDMSNMFGSCYLLRNILLGEVFDTSKVTTMQWMFNGCKALTSIDLTKFNTSSVKNMDQMFASCESLTSLSLKGLDLSNLEIISWFCYGCKNLESINLELSENGTPKLTDMSVMFGDCKKLTEIDMSAFTTSNVTNMSIMLAVRSATSIIIDLTSFDTSNVTNMMSMFQCSGTIYVSDSFIIKSGTNITSITSGYTPTFIRVSEDGTETEVTIDDLKEV